MPSTIDYSAACRSISIDFDDSFGKSLRRFLRQVVADAALDDPVCVYVVSGVSTVRKASRFACVGSFQYARMGFQPSLSPSTYALPFCVMMAVTRSGCLVASL